MELDETMSPHKSRPAPARPTSVPLDTITTTIGMKMKLIPPGEFMMGDESWDWSMPLHRVKITKPFYMGIYQMTQREWTKVMGNNPSSFKKDDNPVENVSWEDCQLVIGKLNEIEPEACYRLPSEAEWEYACRAGSIKRYCFGDRESELGNYGWYDANSGDETHPVGKKKPNAWGLYDMHGNVWEWCWDWYDEKYYQKCHEQGLVEDPQGPGAGSRRVERGGSWNNDAGICGAGGRDRDAPGHRIGLVGVRLARSFW